MYQKQIEELKQRIENTTDWLEKSELEGELFDLEIKAGEKLPPKPLDSYYECLGCGS